MLYHDRKDLFYKHLKTKGVHDMSVSANRILCDELDYKIITELKKDTRAVASAIAAAVDSTERTVRRRINRLVETGIIRFDIYVDPAAFGYVVSVDIFLEIPRHTEDEILEKLQERPEVFYIAYGQQSQEISLHAKFKDSAQMFDFIQKTLPSFGDVVIKGYALIPRIVKMMHNWSPRENDFQIAENKDSSC